MKNWNLICWIFGCVRVGQHESPHPEGKGKLTKYYLAPFCRRCGTEFEIPTLQVDPSKQLTSEVNK